MSFRLTKKELSWALYDWGNSAFATIVMASMFPLMLRNYWLPADAAPEAGTILLGRTSAIAGAIVAIMAPLAGAIGDRRGNRCRLLTIFAGAGILATAGLAIASKGNPTPAILLYLVASVGFAGANAFYDSLLIGVTNRDRFDFISGVGYSLGYLGGGILFAGVVVLLAKPDLLGFASTSSVARFGFLLVAAWWLIFTIPMLTAVKDTVNPDVSPTAAVREGFQQLVGTFHHVRKNRTTFLFLIAYFFYIDGINTVMKMAVDYGAALNLPDSALVKALLVTQFVGFPAAIIYSKLGEKIGAARGILIGIGIYACTIFWAARMTSAKEFYALAVIIGLAQGGIQALSRSLYASLIPEDKASEFFGFYNMLGKLSSILGPLLMALVAQLTGNPRLSILALLPLFGLGALILVIAKTNQAKQEAPPA